MIPAVLRDRSFRNFWLAAATSGTGTLMQRIAVAYYLTFVTHEAKWAGLMIGAAWLGRSAVMLGGSSLLARFGGRRLLFGATLAQTCVALLLALAFATGHHAPWQVVFIEAIAGALTGLEIPGRMHLFGHMFDEQRSQQARYVGFASEKLGFALGPLFAAVLIGSVSYSI